MEERQEFKDDFIKGFAKKGNRTMSNENFDDQLMQKIYARVAYKKEVAAKLKWSMRFFYGALSLIGIYLFISILNRFTSNNTTHFIPVLTLFFIISIGITFVGNYKKVYTNVLL